jgi:hypothetical protein
VRLSEEQLFKRLEALKNERHIWEQHWAELADYILPRKNDMVSRDVTPGRKKGSLLFDNTGMNALELLAGSLHSMLTNPATVWFELTSGEDELDDLDEVRTYLQWLGKQMHRVLNDTNFQTEVHEHYLDLCCFGTSCMFMEEDDKNVIHFNVIHLSEIYIAENNLGVIEEVHRKFEWDARQLIAEFYPELSDASEAEIEAKVTRDVAKAYKMGERKKFEISHSVYRSDFRQDRRQPFLSQYMLITNSEKKLLREGGYRTFPYLVSRWTKVSGETYGRSPGMNALPEIKTVNAMTKAVLKGAQKTVDPMIQLPDDGFIKPRHMRPGGFMYYRAGTQDRAQPVFNDTRIDLGVELTRDRQARIRDSFFVDQLMMNTGGPMMTATEVERRLEERNRFMGPVVGRQHHEFLRPLVERLFDVMVNRDLIGVPPEVLQERELGVRYSSAIARAQRTSEGENLLRAYQASEPFLAQDQSGLDLINVDEIVKENWRTYGAPQRVLRSRDEVEAIRDARQAAQEQVLQQEQGMDQAEQLNKVSPLVSQ